MTTLAAALSAIQSGPAPARTTAACVGVAESLAPIFLVGDIVGRAHVARRLTTPELQQTHRFAVVFPDPLTQPFRDALQFLDGQSILSPAQFEALLAEYGDAAYGVALSANDAYQQIAERMLIAAQEKGWTVGEMQDALKARLAAGDWLRGTQASPFAQLVARGAVMQSYNRGTWDQAQDLGLQYWEYNTQRDLRVRPLHRLLEGKVFRFGEQTDDLYPPNDPNCRCYARPLTGAEVVARGIVRPSAWPTKDGQPVLPGEGYEGSPATSLETMVERGLARRDARLRLRVPQEVLDLLPAGWRIDAVY